MTLSRRLREAAIARAKACGATVDSFVLDEDGVLDLRDFDGKSSAAGPPVTGAALSQFAGQFGDSTDVDDLYAGRRRHPASRKAAPDTGAEGAEAADGSSDDNSSDVRSGASANCAPQLSSIPLSSDLTEPEIDLTESEIELTESVIDLTTATTQEIAGSPDRAVDHDNINPNSARKERNRWIEPIDWEETVAISPKAAPQFESAEVHSTPAPCPRCTTNGTRDLFDRFRQIDFYSCPHCFHMWQAPHTE